VDAEGVGEAAREEEDVVEEAVEEGAKDSKTA